MMLSVFTTIYVLAGPIADVDVVPGEVMEQAQCHAMVETYNAKPQPTGMETDNKGRKLLAIFYKCRELAAGSTAGTVPAKTAPAGSTN
jgi:hypothetical protein